MKINISDICQIVTAFNASHSLIWSLIVQKRKQKYSQSKLVSTWLKGNKCLISNQSSSAIYNVFMFADLNTEKCSLYKHLDRINPYYLPFAYFEVIPPKSIFKTQIQLNSGAGNHHVLPSLLFTDSQNNKWYRHENGFLKPLDANYLDRLSKKGYVLGHV